MTVEKGLKDRVEGRINSGRREYKSDFESSFGEDLDSYNSEISDSPISKLAIDR